MSATKIAVRYARALFRLAKDDQARAAGLMAPLESVEALFEIDAARRVLESPVMPADLKRQLILHAISKADSKALELEKFVDSVIAGGRVAILPEIVAAFKKLVADKAGIVVAEVEVVRPLDAAQKDALQAQLKTVVKKDVQIVEKVNPEILGGLVVRFGNSLLDLSIRSKLNSIAKNAAV